MDLKIRPGALQAISATLTEKVPHVDHIEIAEERNPRGKHRKMWYVRAWDSSVASGPVYLFWFEHGGDYFGRDFA